MNPLQCQNPSLPRRAFIRAGALGLLGFTAADWLATNARAQSASPPKAKSIIQLWMSGGPPHLDTFDPKPDAGEDYNGPLKAIPTNVPGICVGELLPLLAKQADKFSILRGVTHGENAHETATYLVQTGAQPCSDLAYPCIGSVVALKKGYEAGSQGSLPPYICLTTPLGRFSDEGFLGDQYTAFNTGGDPNAKEFRVGGLVPVRGINEKRPEDRRLIPGDARKAFDLSAEKDDLRDRYGRNTFGQSCLLARRLVEHRVPFITINDVGWDTHTDHFPAMKKKLPVLDRGFATLLADLAQRGLLASTIVLWCGEFGRTPKIALEPPWNGGRHHFAKVFSCVVAGGGFKGGNIVGASDAKGETVLERPVYPWDLTASIYQLMGIDPHGRLPHPQGRVAYVTPPAGGSPPSGGLLSEIM